MHSFLVHALCIPAAGGYRYMHQLHGASVHLSPPDRTVPSTPVLLTYLLPYTLALPLFGSPISNTVCLVAWQYELPVRPAVKDWFRLPVASLLNSAYRCVRLIRIL